MKYVKPPLSFDQQADLLIQRGMAGDRELMKIRLAAVNYYRLSGYWYPFRTSNDTFGPGTTFETVWQRYVFDRRLRLLVLDAIERLEVAIRSQLAYHHAHKHGPFAYANNAASLPKLGTDEHRDFIKHVKEETERSREPFIKHFWDKYGDSHTCLPIWIVTEIMSLGTILTFYRGASHQVKQAVASVFGMPFMVFDSWLLTLNTVRNVCAHHGRLWSREIGVKPIIPRIGNYPDWHTPVKVENNRVFAVLTICRYCLRCVASQSLWPQRLKALLDEFPDIPRTSMGFPVKWLDCPIWKETGHGG